MIIFQLYDFTYNLYNNSNNQRGYYRAQYDNIWLIHLFARPTINRFINSIVVRYDLR